MSTPDVFIDLSPAHFSASPVPSSTSSQPAPRAALAPLHNHNYPSSPPTASKPQKLPHAIFAPYSRPQVSQRVSKTTPLVAQEESAQPSASSSASTSTSTAPAPASAEERFDRPTFLEEWDYADMRSRLTRVELGKKPFLHEEGVLFHSPAEPSATYDMFYQTTHDFLDLPMTLHMYPTFVDLPLHLRPSKALYDVTKQNEDRGLRVRCLFCRGRFGGKNAKAIWERHVKEHWPKLDRPKESSKEESRRPTRTVQKRPAGSNAHSRTKSHDSSAWAPASRYNASTSSPSPPSSRASSEEYIPPRSITPAVSFPAAGLATTTTATIERPRFSSPSFSSDEDDSEVGLAIRVPFIRSPFLSPRRQRAARTNPFQRDDDDSSLFTSFQSCWDIDANLEWIEQTSKPCLSKDQLQAALDAATSRKEDEFTNASPTKMARMFRHPIPTGNPTSLLRHIEPPNPRKRIREEDLELIGSNVAWLPEYYSASNYNAQQQSRHKRRHTESSTSGASCSGGGHSDSSASSGEDNDSSLEYSRLDDAFESEPSEVESLMNAVNWEAATAGL